MSRRAALAAALVTAAAGLGVAAPMTASAAACASTPVLESATRNGSASLGAFKVNVDCSNFSGSQDVSWNVVTSDDAYDIGTAALADTWTVQVRTGSVVPRVTDTHGAGVDVERWQGNDRQWHVKITAKPVLLLGECDQSTWPWKCPLTATQQWDGYLDGHVTDYGSWEDIAQRNAFFGMDYSSNISAGAIPPEVVNDPDSDAQMIKILLANPHYTQGGAVFKGFAHVRIPNAFLKEVYEVDTPSTLTSAGLDPELSGTGSGSLSVTDDGSALVVNATNMTFSARSLRVHRGTITPSRPGNLTTKRTGSGTAKLSFTASKARGSKITGYQAKCVARTGTHTVWDKETTASPQYISGLRSGVAYDCKVRALSKAGAGSWTPMAKVPGKPA